MILWWTKKIAEGTVAMPERGAEPAVRTHGFQTTLDEGGWFMTSFFGYRHLITSAQLVHSAILRQGVFHFALRYFWGGQKKRKEASRPNHRAVCDQLQHH